MIAAYFTKCYYIRSALCAVATKLGVGARPQVAMIINLTTLDNDVASEHRRTAAATAAATAASATEDNKNSLPNHNQFITAMKKNRTLWKKNIWRGAPTNRLALRVCTARQTKRQSRLFPVTRPLLPAGQHIRFRPHHLHQHPIIEQNHRRETFCHFARENFSSIPKYNPAYAPDKRDILNRKSHEKRSNVVCKRISENLLL